MSASAIEISDVPETFGGTIPHETVVSDMREAGILPAKHHELHDDIQPALAQPTIHPKLDLTPRVHVTFGADQYDGAFLMGYRAYYDLAPFTTIEARKAEILPMLLADMEEALPVLRAMVRQQLKCEVK